MRFEFATAGRILFGPGTLEEVGPAAHDLVKGGDVLVVCGRSPDRARRLLDLLAGQGLHHRVCSIPGEPTVAMIEQAVRGARTAQCRLVIGFGGGSVLDAAKAIAALITNPGQVLDYLEVIGRNQPLTEPPLPCIAIPTTAGTGAEVTRNAVLASEAHRVKVSLRHPLMLPRIALVDPELTYALPPAITASTGMDALTQLIEAFTSGRANAMTDAVCREGIARAARSLARVYADGRDAPAREDMAIASLFGGLALANAGLGAVHGFAGPIGGMFPAPHGAVCATLLPHVLRANIGALRARTPGSPVLARYEELARIVTGRPDARPEEAVEWTRDLCARFAIPSLRTYGLADTDIAPLVEKARAASSMKANPIALTDAELTDILAAAL